MGRLRVGKCTHVAECGLEGEEMQAAAFAARHFSLAAFGLRCGNFNRIGKNASLAEGLGGLKYGGLYTGRVKADTAYQP